MVAILEMMYCEMPLFCEPDLHNRTLVPNLRQWLLLLLLLFLLLLLTFCVLTSSGSMFAIFSKHQTSRDPYLIIHFNFLF